ncbi:S-adenosyl-L-methionine-dependent methyltransferase [Cryphonectria parasitica EP155]|uniref:S-adenosyl-L-methionine-dependent methyltransferase n=1 Tax=Cryphonectria parasitica (strain ATCC 38755 / EP155) TaxID=660469 RepID=A0A9P4XX72_CRYP1|nr:S-adenosyl-L-methionine-dependent methyltransferase [Cryphonectria parasitica EP155]KAF3762658.1 S-adenosyl-L-methionine-dependent methyltransferase [Cryphonectria parasitica EP155]
MASYPSIQSIQASPELLRTLQDLHAQALAEEAYVSTSGPASLAVDKFVALDPDKCAAVYLLLRSTGARHVVEAGTSFGLSTIYLALAVGQNVGGDASKGRVVATEHEASKARQARAHWARAGAEVEPFVELREGDLLETLKSDLPDEVDFLLLDIWTPLALPTLKLVQPRLKKGAMIIADNVEAAKAGYRDLLEYVSNPENGFRTMNLPFSGGLQLIVRI